MSVNEKALNATATIERAYRERRGGFLAWARLHAPDDASAEDALHDAFIKAIANADALSVAEDVAGWIFSVMRNRLIDLWRREDAQRRAGVIDLSEETIEEIISSAGFDPHDSFIRTELEEALSVALEALPREQRDVIRAQAIEGTTFRELAEKTGVPIDTLMSRKRRALRKLAAALEYWMED
jgi:RNA polymerase sigma factor, sigma-70 family